MAHDDDRPELAVPGDALLRLATVIGVMALLVGSLMLPAAVAANRTVDAFSSRFFDVPPLPEALVEPALSSFVLASDGSVVARLHAEQDRIAVELESIADVAWRAVVATEDQNFFRHNGVAHRAIVRAAVENILAGRIAQGASTITQQYVRNTLLSAEETMERKIHEALWAVELETRLSKGEILESYLNTAYFGNGRYGIATAARFYFSKTPDELDAAEAAMLAGLIRAPEANDPLDNPEAARQRRNIVLRQMVATGFLDQAEADRAKRQPLGLNLNRTEPTEPFVIDWVKRVMYDPAIDLQPELQEALGDTVEKRLKKIFRGGLTVETTLDRRMQKLADQTLKKYLDDPLDDPLGALVTLETETGAVKSMAIGPKAYGECPSGQTVCKRTKVNPVVPGGGGEFGRQPGSAFKPIVATAALAHGFSPTWSVTTPSGVPIPGCGYREPYAPENYSGHGRGVVNMYEGVENSVNVWAVKLAKAVGIQNVIDMTHTLGIEHSPNLDDFGPKACSIGIGTANVYPLEMARVYATFANDGVRCDPYIISRVLDRDGDVLYEVDPSKHCQRVISKRVARRMLDILRGPPSPGGTAPYVGYTLDRPVRGKTGTTDDWVDAWFLAVVPQYATAAWVGYEHPESMFGVEANGVTYGRVTGGTIPAHMWADYMVQVLENVPAEDFPPPIDSVSRYRHTGPGAAALLSRDDESDDPSESPDSGDSDAGRPGGGGGGGEPGGGNGNGNGNGNGRDGGD